MNKPYKIFNKQATVWMLAAVLAFAAVSCQKDLDYSRPPGANTFEGDKTNTFRILTSSEDSLWAWNMPLSLFGTEFPSMLLQFFTDSTANVYAVARRGIVPDLQWLRSSGTLTAGQSSQVLQLINAFSGINDYTLRDLLEDPQNINFKNALLVYLPNYEYFNSLLLGLQEQGAAFDMNGPVQLSLTFHNAQFLSELKALGGLDFDFRVMGVTPDSVALDGYYGNDVNKLSSLHKVIDMNPINFINSSRVTIAVNPLKAKVAMRTGGTLVPTPAGYTSGIDFFYRTFNQAFDSKAGYGYKPNGKGAAVMPDVLKTAKILTVKSVIATSPVTAPVGTVIMTMTVVNVDGSVKEVEFVKN
ncbi:hypothetical protein EGT74_13565 [Chitinophaga lutea]|uniref:Uncharacterized protein n=1 Tax=Chitinophaga lutea TaxID=2488634 RepID=A0A3N4PHB7_9BACT|nr:hypothetical protein [Chitinophaga lutea]RPE08093.1 hypothetical protein EGT74_13565 [Chitinophaga lutea]